MPEGTGFNVDGELFKSGPVRLRVEPRAFELVTGYETGGRSPSM